MSILYSGTEGTCQWTIDDQWHLYIESGVINHNTTSSSEWSWDSYRNDIVSVSSENVSWTQNADASYMFFNCGSLTSLDLSNFDTSNVTDMSYMFYGCDSLTSLNLSNFDTSNVTNMRDMFDYCSSLASLDLSNFDTSKVTNMRDMFDYCSSLASLDLSNFDTSKVTDMGDMFGGCQSLTSLDLSNFNTSNVTNMVSMFNGCHLLTSLNLSSFDTSNVTTMHHMFSYCNALISLDLSNFDTSKVTNMSYMFYNCNSLTALDLSGFDTSNVTDMSSMFGQCRALTSLNLSNFDTSNVTNMNIMFYNCNSLITIMVSNLWDVINVNNSSYMFTSCSVLVGEQNTTYNSSYTDKTYAHIDGGVSNPGYLTNINSVPCYASFDSSNGELRIFRDVSGKYTNNQVIGTKTYWTGVEDITGNTTPKWYSKRANIQSVKIINKFSPKTTSHMFEGCSVLTSLDLSNFNTSNVTNMLSMFSGCWYLTSLDLSNFDTSNVTDMNGMFYGCNHLTSLDLSNFNISNVTNMLSMFSHCNSLTSLNLSNLDTSNVTDMAYMFSDCTSLISLNLSSFDTSNVTNMSGMFQECNSLTSLDLSNFNTSNVTDMGDMFLYCNSLTSLKLSNLDTSNVTDMAYMFYDCSDLTYLELKVSNVPQNYASIFDNITCPIYIINALDSSATNPTKEQVATFWREIVASYSNAHYEADDLTVTFAPNPIVSRETIAKLPKFVSPSLITSFVYQSNNLLPNSWHFNISKVTGHLKDYNTNYLDDTNPAASISTSTNQYSKTVNNYYFNNKTTAILSLYITIYDANNTIKESNRQTDETESSVSGANLPMLDEDFTLDKTNRFLYQIIPNKTEVGIYAYDENRDYSGVTLPSSTTIDGQSYDVTKLNIDIYNPDGTAAVYGCFESNSLTNITSIPTPVVDLRRFLYNCQNLQKHNITYAPQSIRPIVYTDAFSNINTDIFLVNSQGVTTLNETVHEIANAFSKVHYEYTDNPEPKFDSISIPSTRYVYDNENIQWIEDDDGTWAKITTKIILSEAFLPVGKTNAFKSIACSVNNEIVEIRDENYSLVDANSLVSNQDKNLYIEIGTSKAITELIVIDTCDHSVTYSYTFSPLFAMLDFMPGGKGMAIGKIAERNGLDVAIPTTIGEGLLPATQPINPELATESNVDSSKIYYTYDSIKQKYYKVENPTGNPSSQNWYKANKEYIDLSNYQLITGQYNKENIDALFIIGNGENDNNRFNLMEVGTDLITIGNKNKIYTELDENGQRFYQGSNIIANIGYGEGVAQSGTANAPYFTFGTRQTTNTAYDATATYSVGDRCIYDNKPWICIADITTPEAFNPTHWQYNIGNMSVAEGKDVISSGLCSHAEGRTTWASGNLSHAEGNNAYALGSISHAENYLTRAVGDMSHAEGDNTHAIGNASHAEGYATWADGNYSHAQGQGTIAAGNYSHAQGYHTRARGKSQTVLGEYNVPENVSADIKGNYAVIIGNGTAYNATSNALTIDWDGKVECGDYSGNFKSVFNIFYPKGSYYETHLPYTINDHSYDDDNLTDADIALCGDTWFDPRVAWGGTWELELEGQVHVSAGTNYSVAGALTDTSDGGNKDAVVVSHTHELTRTADVAVAAHGVSVTQPVFTIHTVSPNNTGSYGTGQVQFGKPNGTSYTNSSSLSRTTNVAVSLTNNHSITTQPEFTCDTPGEAGTNKNMPPYIIVYRWHRTA